MRRIATNPSARKVHLADSEPISTIPKPTTPVPSIDSNSDSTHGLSCTPLQPIIHKNPPMKKKKSCQAGYKVLNTCTPVHIAEDTSRKIMIKVIYLHNQDPPSLNNQKELSLWVCRQHNYVNKILGKPQYSCDYEGLMKRWKTGCDFDSY